MIWILTTFYQVMRSLIGQWTKISNTCYLLEMVALPFNPETTLQSMHIISILISTIFLAPVVVCVDNQHLQLNDNINSFMEKSMSSFKWYIHAIKYQLVRSKQESTYINIEPNPHNIVTKIVYYISYQSHYNKNSKWIF